MVFLEVTKKVFKERSCVNIATTKLKTHFTNGLLPEHIDSTVQHI